MRLLKFAILSCLSMMFATSYAQMAVKETDKRKAAIDVFDDKDFELQSGIMIMLFRNLVRIPVGHLTLSVLAAKSRNLTVHFLYLLRRDC